MVEMRMGEQDLVDDVDAVAVLELQQRRHHAHAAVDQRVPHDLAVLPLDERVRDVGLPVGITARPSSARGLSKPNSMPNAGWMPLTRRRSSVMVSTPLQRCPAPVGELALPELMRGTIFLIVRNQYPSFPGERKYPLTRRHLRSHAIPA